MTDPVRQIADAVLYEGYILWPYRRSAMKNAQRWTFGGVYPRSWNEGHPDDRWQMQAQVLVLGDPTVDVTVRFLHVVRRQPHDPVRGRALPARISPTGPGDVLPATAATRPVTPPHLT